MISKFLKKNQFIEYLSLFLSIFWLYVMNTVFFIQDSRIEIEDFSMSKSSRIIQKSELVFNQEHNLLMYLKIILTSQSDEENEKNDEIKGESDDSENSNNSDNFSDIKNKNF